MKEYIRVDRQFMPFKDEQDWELQYSEIFSDGFLGAEHWDDILKHRRVVILAEARAGKTTELRNQVKDLKDQGQFAFYLTVSDLAECELQNALYDAHDQGQLDDWQTSIADHAYFLVDSIDEAKLDNKSFSRALRNLAKAIVGKEHIAHIYLSCRVSDWNPILDVDLVQEHLCSRPLPTDFPLTPEETEKSVLSPIFGEQPGCTEDSEAQKVLEPYVVALAPLSRQQIRKFAHAKSVRDVDKLLEAMKQGSALDLINRPGDLLPFLAFWKANGEIQGKYQLMQWSIHQMLHEENDARAYKDTLSLDAAIDAFRSLAAALALTQKRFIAVPSANDVAMEDTSCIVARDFLGDFSVERTRWLLTRPIFDPASLGRIRFHHRSMQELLCAQWLLGLLAKGCPAQRIWELLATKTYGRVYLRPSLRPVAAWIGQLDSGGALRKFILNAAPEVLIEDGDPASLDTETRAVVLRHFAKHYGSRSDANVSIDIGQLDKLACTELAPTIREIWVPGDLSSELSSLLLRLIWIGKIQQCSDIALSAALALDGGYSTVVGLRAIGEFGTFEERKQIATFLLENIGEIGERVAGEALSVVFPSVTKIETLVELLESVGSMNRSLHPQGLVRSLSDIIDTSEIANLESLVRSLGNLLQSAPLVDNKHYPISARYGALVEPILRGCSKLVLSADGKPVSSDVARLARLAFLSEEHNQHFMGAVGGNSFQASLKQNLEAKRQQFWLSISPPSDPSDTYKFNNEDVLHSCWSLSSDDWDWLESDARFQKEPFRRFAAFEALYELVKGDPKSEDRSSQLTRLASSSSELEAYLNWLRRDPLADLEYLQKRSDWRAKRAREEEKGRQDWLQYRNRLCESSEHLCSMESFADLSILVRWLLRASKSTQYAALDMNEISEAYSPSVRKNAESGFVNVWIERAFNKKDGDGSLNTMHVAALRGLSVLFDRNSNFASVLSKSDVLDATNLAFRELNDFPQWADGMWFTRCEVIEDVFRERIEGLIKLEDTTHPPGIHLQNYCRTSEPFRSVLAKWVVEALDVTQPARCDVLERLLDIVVGAEHYFEHCLTELASKWYSRSNRSEFNTIWLSVLLATNAELGLRKLSDWLDGQVDDDARASVMISLLNELFPHHVYAYGKRYRSLFEVEHLRNLLPLVFKYVSPADDRMHEGAYRPDSRDDAEYARSQLLQVLVNTPGREAFDALMALSLSPAFQHCSERIRTLAEQRAALDSNMAPWSPLQFHRFKDSFEVMPRTVRELHELVCNRMTEVKEKVEQGDFSPKRAWRQDTAKSPDETIVQLGIADELSRLSREIYTVERESELENRRKPDIRIQQPGISEAIPLEIKIGDNWHYGELVHGIEEQLIKRYMRPRGATHGHYVFTTHGRKGWRTAGGIRITKNRQLELVKFLQIEADSLADKHKEIESILVTGIDLKD